MPTYKEYVQGLSSTTPGNGDEIAIIQSGEDYKATALGIAQRVLIDEDNMASNSDTRAPSQQSVKAYVDAIAHFRGVYVSLVALQSAVPSGNAGDYAFVDAGTSNDAQMYIWDNDDNDWVLSGSGGAATWGSITGTLSNQTDLITYISEQTNKARGLMAFTGL